MCDDQENPLQEGAVLVQDNTSEHSLPSAFATPIFDEKNGSLERQYDSNDTLQVPDDLIITGENTVYSTSHGLEYFVDSEGNFYYSGTNEHFTSDENGTTKDEEFEETENTEDIDDYLYIEDQERSIITADENSYNVGSLELDEDGDYVVEDINISEKNFSAGTNNSNTIESYNNSNLYQLAKASPHYERNHHNTDSNTPGFTGSNSDSGHHLSTESNQAPLYVNGSGESYNQDTKDLARLAVSVDDIDEFLYNDDDDGDDPLDIEIDDIDDGGVADIHVDELDELDEEIYKRLSKIANQKSQNNVFHKGPFFAGRS